MNETNVTAVVRERRGDRRASSARGGCRSGGTAWSRNTPQLFRRRSRTPGQRHLDSGTNHK